MKTKTAMLSRVMLAIILVISLGVGPMPASALSADTLSENDKTDFGELAEPSSGPAETPSASADTPSENSEGPNAVPGDSAPPPQENPPLTNPSVADALDAANGSAELAEDPATIYTVKFFTWDGHQIGEPIDVEEGAAVQPPAAPDRPGYRFTGWSEDINNVSGNWDIYAEYVELKSYSITVSYIFADSTIARQPVIFSVEEGGSFSKTIASPAISGYTADRASVDIQLTDIDEDFVATVTYTPATDTPSKIQHYQQKLVLVNAANPRDPANYDLVSAATQNLTGKTGALVTASAQTFTGFSAPATMPSAQIAADGTTTLKVYYDRNQYAVYFDSAGGSYVAPIAALYGAALSAPTVPTRAGYTFDGWSATFPATMPAGDISLTAKWKASGTVNYTLVYYLENISSTGYDYVGTATQSAAAGATPSVPSAIPSGVTFPIASNRFALNTLKTNAELPASVSGDGTTIVNVYYDRNSYTISFQFASKYNLTVGGTTYTASPYQLTAKFGASINAKWPGAPVLRNGNSDGTFIGWAGSSVTYVTTQYYMDDNIINNAPLSASWDKNAKTINVVYNFKDLVGGGYTSNPAFNQTVAVDSNSTTWNAKSFLGFTVQQTPVTITNNTATFYYDRNQYKITYYNGGTIDRTSTNYYQADISGSPFSQAPAARPANVPSGYVFAGWYTSPQGFDNSRFTFSGATMPANNMILYARWDKPNYTAIFNPDNGSPTFSQTVPALSTLTQPVAPTKPGYTFGGWYLPASTLKYTFSFPVNANLSLTARWIPISNISYDVVFQKNGVEFQRQTYSGKSVGDTVTANAITVAGFLPDALSKSLALGAASNQIVFNYTPINSPVGYTVKYQDSQGTQLVLPKQAQSSQASVTENYVNISGYYPNFYQQTLVLTPNASNNVITFVYTKNADVTYTVRSLYENLDGSYAIVDQVKQAPAGSRVTEQSQQIEGFTFRPDLSINDRVIASDGSTIIRLAYNRNVYAVSFNVQGQGSLSGTAAFNVKYESLFGTAVVAPMPVPTPGYKFVGWTPALPENGSKVTGAATYTATFEKDPTQWATVTFEGNGADNEGAMPDSSELLIGSSYTLPDNIFTLANHTFVDWDTNPDGTGYAYADKEVITVNGNMTLYAQWVENSQYQVVYYGNGGTGTLTDPQRTYYVGASVTVLDNNVATGFVYPGNKFVGWEDQHGTPFAPDETFLINENTYFYAQWEHDDSQWTTIVYDKNGGDEITGTMSAIDVLTGQPFTLAANGYSRDHYRFAGWNTNADGSGTAYADSASITPQASGQLTLYAQWVAIPQYTITYNPNGAPGDVRTASDYEGASTTILPADTFSYEHNDFVRWSTSPDGTGNAYFPGNAITLTGTVTLYAFWVPRAFYSLTYNDGFSDGTFTTSDYADALGNLDITVEPNPFVRVGYTFDRWESSTLGTAYPGNKIDDINASATFTAHWLPVTYAITYDLDGGTVSGGNPTQYTIETPAFDITAPTKPGYIFAGWTGTDLDSETQALTIGPGRWGDLSYTAHWEKDPAQWATVTFAGNGADNDGAMASSEEMLVGSSYTLPSNTFTRANYDFVNWDTNPAGTGVASIDGQTITVNGNVTLYAQWVGNGSYAVVYLGNGGAGTLTDANTYTFNSTVTVLKNDVPTGFVKPGYRFDGWHDQDGTPIVENSTFSITRNTYLSAQWAYDASHWTDIVYDKNAGDAIGTMPNESVLTGQPHALAANSYSREHYVFAGWNTLPDGSGTPHADQASITPDASGSLTLYAQWTEAFYTVTYKDGFSNGSFTETSYLDQGDLEIVVAKNPFVRSGYDFTNWLSDSSTAANPDETIEDLQSDVVFTAQWSPHEYGITYDLDGGVVNGSNLTNYTVETPAFDVINPTKPGYTFAGWTGTDLYSITQALTVGAGQVGDLEFTAHWLKDASQWSTITFANSDPAKGTVTGVMQYEGIKGTPITIIGAIPAIVRIQAQPPLMVQYPASTAHDGYVFLGWDKSVPSEFPQSDLTITALWKADDPTDPEPPVTPEKPGENPGENPGSNPGSKPGTPVAVGSGTNQGAVPPNGAGQNPGSPIVATGDLLRDGYALVVGAAVVAAASLGLALHRRRVGKSRS